MCRDAMNNGLIEYTYRLRHAGERPLKLAPAWLLTLFANALVSVERFRRRANQPETEYGLEFEILVQGDEVPIGRYGDPQDVRGPLAKMPVGRQVFPRYAIGSPSEFGAILSLFESDVWNLCGRDWDEIVSVDFDQLMLASG
ncbi:MAG: hypothetical protein EXQ99_07825 [Alphaproteobacteria bacterium]|nr:hypothetical protein [Alphaproteobacteria bacterium]